MFKKFFFHIKMLTGSKNKERSQKKAYEKYQNFLEEKKTENSNIIVSNTEIFQKKEKQKASTWSQMI